MEVGFIYSMSSKLIFLNLDIDRHLDKDGIQDKIFRIRNPYDVRIIDSYQGFGLFCGNSEDVLLTNILLPQDYLDFLHSHNIITPSIVPLDCGPSDVFGSNRLSLQSNQITRAQFVADSPIEQMLWNNLLNLSPRINQQQVDKISFLNRKDFLLRLQQKIKFAMPESVVLESQEICKYLSEHAQAYPLVLKLLQSSGGSGTIFIKNEHDQKLKFIDQLKKFIGQESFWILQRGLQRQMDYCTFAEVKDGKTQIVGTFQVHYDEKNSSWLHHSVEFTPLILQIQKTAQQIGSSLAIQDYQGAFSIDSIVDCNGNLFPAIDLNVRLDKSRLIYHAALAFDLPVDRIFSRRLKFVAREPLHFKYWWSTCCENLGLNSLGDHPDGYYFYPYIVGSLFHATNMPQQYPVEICFFFGCRVEIPRDKMQSWLKIIEHQLMQFSTTPEAIYAR